MLGAALRLGVVHIEQHHRGEGQRVVENGEDEETCSKDGRTDGGMNSKLCLASSSSEVKIPLGLPELQLKIAGTMRLPGRPEQ